MARMISPLGGYTGFGGRGMPPPGQVGIEPWPQGGGGGPVGPPIRYGQGSAGALGPPAVGNAPSQATLPPIGGPRPPNPKFQPLGGYSRPGSNGLPPRQGDGPENLGLNRTTVISSPGTRLPPPGGSTTLPPISLGRGGSTAPPLPTPGGQPAQPPRQLGPELVPGVSRNYYGGGPPMRWSRPTDQRTGKPARGAADIMASMVAGGWQPWNTDGTRRTDFQYSYADADRDKAAALASLAEGYNNNALGDIDARMYENYLATGSFFNENGMPWLAYPDMYDSTYRGGEYGGEGFSLPGQPPMPTVPWGLDETPTEAQLAQAQADWDAYQAALAAWESQTYGKDKKPPGYYGPRGYAPETFAPGLDNEGGLLPNGGAIQQSRRF